MNNTELEKKLTQPKEMQWTDESAPSRTDLKSLAAKMRVGDRLLLNTSIIHKIPALDLLLAGFSKPDETGVCTKRMSDFCETEDQEQIDEDDLLEESDITRKTPSTECDPDAETSKQVPKKRACANCTCGLADALDSSEPKTSACGSVSYDIQLS